jgi:hypothetical protein
MPERGVLAVFADVGQAARAIRALRAEGLEVRASMPAPFPEVTAVLGRPKSALGLSTLGGAVVGGGLGLLLAAWTSRSLPIVTGGMEIVSLPAYLVIVFELAVLVGALANFVGLLSTMAAGRRTRPVPDDPRFSYDRIGLFVPGGAGKARELFAAAGAEEVRDAVA